ncbi:MULTISPECIES: endonuclease NucS domain-containing protein [Priestia]|uniref:endonuclease NucS domain-containing protein n=1 Tax=Priestia TaxID=2800373 RepID=UPI000C9C255F|nr:MULTISPECIES: endonuclease NucS domain-containing protein [Priestia]MBX9996058.1 DUF91 domain-containing protein [Priestia aryabhattai]PNE08467.1 DUF91 domain-containing protein [Priestia megaterium]
MKGFLISYKDKEDPNFSEFTYGSEREGKRLLTLQKGDVLFFHKSISNGVYITAYMVVEMVLKVEEAKLNTFINDKYKNPHLLKEEVTDDEAVVFGNPVFSKVLDNPYKLEQDFLNQLSRKPNFNNYKQTYKGAIASALRTMKELNRVDIEILLKAVRENETESRLADNLLSTEEVFQVKETDIEKFLLHQYQLISDNTALVKNQYVLPSGNRIDILLQNKFINEYVVVEIKKGNIGRDEVRQLKDYIKEMRKVKKTYKIKGILVCKGVLPYFEEEIDKLLSDDITLFTYAWKFSLLKQKP